jgi:hypothetical protein
VASSDGGLKPGGGGVPVSRMNPADATCGSTAAIAIAALSIILIFILKTLPAITADCL